MRVLLTGAAGFIGRYVRAELERRGHGVQGVDCYLPQVHGEGPPMDPQILAASVFRFADRWYKASQEQYDAVVHLAAEVGVGQSQYEPLKYVEANVRDTAALWQAIVRHRAEVKQVVVASSMSIYGEGEYRERGNAHRLIRRPESSWDAFDVEYPDSTVQALRNVQLTAMATREGKVAEPASVYAQSKYDTERYSVILGETYDVPTIALRFFNVLGVGQAINNGYTGCVVNFLSRAINGESPLVTEDGRQTRDFVHVHDVARAICDAAEARGASGVFNVCTGRPFAVGDVADAVCSRVNERLGTSIMPTIMGRYRAGDVRHCVGDPSAISRALGWAARRTAEDAINAVVDAAVDAQQRSGARFIDNVPNVFRELELRGLLRSGGGGDDNRQA